MRYSSCKLGRRAQFVLASAVVAVSGAAVMADQRQNQAVSATTAQLTAAGFGTLNGAGISIGQNEPGDPNVYGGPASNVAPTSRLPNGNPNLPIGSVIINSPAPSRANHATQVAGVIVSTVPGQQGIATGAQISSGNTSDIGKNTAGTWSSNNLLYLIQAMRDVNMSWGRNVVNGTGALPGGNNGNNFISPFVDWAVNQYNTVVVVAGNEGSGPNSGTALGSPSDAYNVLNIGATGYRATVNSQVDYTRLAPYTQTNTTADKSAITGYGRIKTDLVAPGGDPFFSLTNNKPNVVAFEGGAGNTAPNTASVPVNGFIDQFVSTAGGFSTSVPSAGPVATLSDTYNGLGGAPAYADTTTASDNVVITNAANVFGAPVGTVIPSTTAGTSFAAPEVTGAAALVTQYGQSQGFSVDHRLIKALLMNGAVHRFNVGGTLVNLTNTDGVTPWSPLPGKGVTPVAPGMPAGFAPTVQPGLDPNLGTGEMNVVNSLLNYKAGQQGPTNVTGNPVNPVGWDVQTVPAGAAANTIVDKYDFSLPTGLGLYGSFQATLAWDDVVTASNLTLGSFGANTTFARNTASGGNYNPAAGTAAPMMTDLDLYLFQLNANGTLGPSVTYSTSDIDNEEYVYSQGLAAGNYELDITNAQYNAPSATPYGLAWSTTYVPEPGSLGLLSVGLLGLMRRRRTRSAK